jgi:hypothetical protein
VLVKPNGRLRVGGLVEAAELSVGPNAKLEASAPLQVRVAGGLTLRPNAFAGPRPGSGLTQPNLAGAVARDPVTGELFEAASNGAICRLGPQTWATTTVDSGTFGKPYALAVSDTGRARRFVVAAALWLFEVGSGVMSSATTISVRMPTTNPTRAFNKQSSIMLLLPRRRSIRLTPLLPVIPATWA